MISVSTRVILLIATVLALVLTFQGYKAKNVLMERAVAQEGVTEAVERWRQNYMALSESAVLWRKKYRREADVPDLLTLFSIVNLPSYGLVSNTDAMMLHKVDTVTQNGAQIGLARVCLASANGRNGASLEVEAINYQALFTGIKELAKRPDIEIGTIHVQGDRPSPGASLGNFCILLSKD